MLWIVTGGVGSGKSAFAERWAAAYGREAVRLTCPAWPTANEWTEEAAAGSQPERGAAFKWTDLPADRSLAERLDRINLHTTNPLRASGRVVIVDSLSGWLRSEIHEMRKTFPPPEVPPPPKRGRKPKPVETPEVFERRTALLEHALGEVVRALLEFEGRRLVVTEEPAGGLGRDRWERWYLRALAAANRRLAEASDGMHVMMAGLAMEWKSQRKRQGMVHHENIYPHGR